MIHPSYKDLLEVVNAGSEEGDPIVSSRYSIVLATAKRARQIISGAEPLVTPKCSKPLSIAVQEVWEGKVRILGTGEEEDDAFSDNDDDSSIDDWDAEFEKSGADETLEADSDAFID
ncbi:MAG: DNA-directed RNA polymerase subunit omega [Lachnospiraceae bacterium]|nr:DNA-directed RNA polymerase subunit omega [Lachnospiraceae bacterium]